MTTLFSFQQEAVDRLCNLDRVALYWDMGLGKTFAGAELVYRYSNPQTLIVCQKSKVHDWIIHMTDNYPTLNVYDLTSKGLLEKWVSDGGVGVVNYDLLSRRPVFKNLRGHCLLLDESSMIQNSTAKRTKVISSMKPAQVVLLSGTPVGGRYEKLYTQIRLLGWNISKDEFWARYIQYRLWNGAGFPMKIVTGYRNVDDLKQNLRSHGATFIKSEEVLGQLPSQTFQTLSIPQTPEYRRMLDTGISTIDGREIVGDSNLAYRIALRQLATVGKSSLLSDILSSTDDRVIVFYTFQRELTECLPACSNRPVSIVNGQTHDLRAYESESDSVTFLQYQAGAMGLNLQKSRIAVFLSPPESSELYEQAKKRIHRIGQSKPCLYYRLVMDSSIELRIYSALAIRKDYTDALFLSDYGSGKVV